MELHGGLTVPDRYPYAHRAAQCVILWSTIYKERTVPSSVSTVILRGPGWRGRALPSEVLCFVYNPPLSVLSLQCSHKSIMTPLRRRFLDLTRLLFMLNGPGTRASHSRKKSFMHCPTVPMSTIMPTPAAKPSRSLGFTGRENVMPTESRQSKR